jgi:hypothetical protein
MKAVAAQNARVVDPVYHVILSWPGGEHPTDEQAFVCGDHAIASVGMGGHQHVYAIHRDTENVHMHIAVSRINPVSYKAVYPSRDFYKLDRAMRELELRFGWRHDKGPYAVFERDGRVIVDWASAAPETKGRMPSAARDMERHGDQESLFSYARGKPRQELINALSDPGLTWQQLHAILGKFGLALKEKGRGFAIYDATTDKLNESPLSVKASDVHEELSKARLVSRLGDFEESRMALTAEESYDRFRAPQRDPDRREGSRQTRAEARRELRARFEAYRSGLVAEVMDTEMIRERFRAIRSAARLRRREVRSNFSDRAIRKAQYSVIAFETIRELERLREKIRGERHELRTRNASARQSYSDWVERQAALGDAAALAQLRGWAYGKRRAKTASAQGMNAAETALVNGFRPVSDLERPVSAGASGVTYKVLRDGSVSYQLHGGEGGFIDRGDFVEVLWSNESRQALVAALLFTLRAFGNEFNVEGDEQFKSAASDLRRLAPTEESLHAQLTIASKEAPKDRTRPQRTI